MVHLTRILVACAIYWIWHLVSDSYFAWWIFWSISIAVLQTIDE